MMPAPMITTSGFDDDAVAVFVDRAITELPSLSLIAISPAPRDALLIKVHSSEEQSACQNGGGCNQRGSKRNRLWLCQS
jgi:hypothetical protein